MLSTEKLNFAALSRCSRISKKQFFKSIIVICQFLGIVEGKVKPVEGLPFLLLLHLFSASHATASIPQITF